MSSLRKNGIMALVLCCLDILCKNLFVREYSKSICPIPFFK